MASQIHKEDICAATADWIFIVLTNEANMIVIVKNCYVRRNIQPFRVMLLKIYYKSKRLFKNKDCRMNAAREVLI